MSMNHYESTVIINGALEEEPIQQIVTRATDFIGRNGGTITKTDHWGRRRLAYAINKKNNGYYVQFQIDAPSEMVALLERFYQLDEHIIRYLTLQLDDSDLQKRDEVREKMAAAEAAALAAAEEENAPRRATTEASEKEA